MDFFSTKITNEEQRALKEKLANDGFSISSVQNALWKATYSGINVTCYVSLKLLVQGKNSESFVDKYLKNKAGFSEQVKLLEMPSENFVHDFSAWIGTDESGKGDYFGPLITAGVYVKREQVDFLVGLEGISTLLSIFISKINNRTDREREL